MKPLRKLLLVYTIVLLTSCASMQRRPVDVPIYISDPPSGSFIGSDRKGNKYSKLFTETGGFFCIAPENAEEVLR
jgi:hypothetical protein